MAGVAEVGQFQDDVFDSDTDSGAPSDEESGSEDDDSTWISWFCSLKGNEFFCEVDEDYIQDDFNLCGLQNMMPTYYDYALDVILDAESPNTDDLTDEQHEIIEGAAETLYGLIHHRYILTARGMQAMFEKYQNGDFGRCPRVLCEGQPCLPVALSDVFRQNTVKIFCPKCEDVYYPRSRYQGQVDGAFFGTTFPHLFLMTYPSLRPTRPSAMYTPKIYGFKLHPTSYTRSISRENNTNNRVSRGRPPQSAGGSGNGAATAGNGNGPGNGPPQENPRDAIQASDRSQPQQPATSNCTDMQQ